MSFKKVNKYKDSLKRYNNRFNFNLGDVIWKFQFNKKELMIRYGKYKSKNKC